MWQALSSIIMKKRKRKKVEEKLSNQSTGLNYSISCANNTKNVVDVQSYISYIFENVSLKFH